LGINLSLHKTLKGFSKAAVFCVPSTSPLIKAQSSYRFVPAVKLLFYNLSTVLSLFTHKQLSNISNPSSAIASHGMWRKKVGRFRVLNVSPLLPFVLAGTWS